MAGSILDDEEEGSGKGYIKEAEDLINVALVKLTPEEHLAYWGYLRRWRAHSTDTKRGSVDCPPRWNVPAQILTADKHRREVITAMHRRKKPTADQVKALAGVNQFLFLEAEDTYLSSWAVLREDT